MFGPTLMLTLALSCSASPVVQKALRRKEEVSTNPTAFALDLTGAASSTTLACFRDSQYNAVFVRGYLSDGNGQVDPNLLTNLVNVKKSGLDVVVYMSPKPNSTKSGGEQFDEMFASITSSGVTGLQSVWIQVTSPMNWFPKHSDNIAFLNAVLARATQRLFLVGIYTNSSDYSLIIGDATIQNIMLWYHNVRGDGPLNESPSNFNDFQPFGGWTSPQVKQIGMAESVCGMTVNRNIYDLTTPLKRAFSNDNSGSAAVGVDGLKVPIGKAEIIA